MGLLFKSLKMSSLSSGHLYVISAHGGKIPRVDACIWKNNANHSTLRACLCVLSSNQVKFDPAADFLFLWSEQLIRNFTVCF